MAHTVFRAGGRVRLTKSRREGVVVRPGGPGLLVVKWDDERGREIVIAAELEQIDPARHRKV